jgi:hypothetical protein
MAMSGLESTVMNTWGTFTGSVEVSFGASSVCLQNTLSMSFGSVQHVVGIQQFQTSNFFGGPTTHNFGTNPWEWPNAIFSSSVINVTFGIATWDDDLESATGVGNIFFMS